MEQVRITRRCRRRRNDESVDVVPDVPVANTDEAAELLARIDALVAG